MEDEVESLNRAFASRLRNRGQSLLFSRGPAGFIFATVQNPFCHARFCLHGAQVLGFAPAGGRELLWLSPRVCYSRDRAIRGGIPLCFPWFGKLPGLPARPQHGFARLLDWSVTEAAEDEAGRTRISLACPPAPEEYSEWKDLEARLELEFGMELRLRLTVRNSGTVRHECTAALHSYFKISHIGNIRVLSREEAHAPEELRAGIQPRGDYDRIFEGTAGPYRIEDSGCDSFIIVNKEKSRSTVIWNPGPEKSAAMSDMGAAGAATMVCVEAARAAGDRMVLEAGGTDSLGLSIGLTPR